MDLYALIVAGGTGKRMGSDIPKQFLELAGRPILMHSIERFRSFDNGINIIVVLPGEEFSLWDLLKKKHSFSIPHSVVKGGSSRFFSVKNGLELVPNNSIVAIHDGARPLVAGGTIRRTFEKAAELGNAIPVIPGNNSLRMLTGNGSIPLERHHVMIVQTPQVFKSDLIKKAYLQDYCSDFTDDATVLEKTGEKINLVEGNRENIKITNPEDLIITAALLSSDF